MNPFFLYHLKNDVQHKGNEHPVTLLEQPEHNLAEGGEFLNDAIRMKEQPLIYTETSVAPGSPEDLL